MIKNNLVIVAERTIRDAETNTISIINYLEGIVVEGAPAFFPLITLFSSWEREAADPEIYPGSISIREGMNGPTIIQQPIIINFQGALRTRFNAMFQGITIKTVANLVFTIAIDGAEPLIYTLEITQRPQK